MALLIEHRCRACGAVSTQAVGSNPTCYHPGKSKRGLKPAIMVGAHNVDGSAQVHVKRAAMMAKNYLWMPR